MIGVPSKISCYKKIQVYVDVYIAAWIQSCSLIRLMFSGQYEIKKNRLEEYSINSQNNNHNYINNTHIKIIKQKILQKSCQNDKKLCWGTVNTRGNQFIPIFLTTKWKKAWILLYLKWASTKSIFAPSLIKKFTKSKFPRDEATCNGVKPSCWGKHVMVPNLATLTHTMLISGDIHNITIDKWVWLNKPQGKISFKNEQLLLFFFWNYCYNLLYVLAKSRNKLYQKIIGYYGLLNVFPFYQHNT